MTMTTPPITASVEALIDALHYLPFTQEIDDGDQHVATMSRASKQELGRALVALIDERIAAAIPGSNTTPTPASGEGPYRASGPWIKRGDETVYYGGTPESTQNWCKALNDAHRAAFAAGAASTAARDSGQGENDPHTNLSSAEQENERLHGRMAEALEACVAARLALTNHNLWCGHNKHAPGHPSCREAKEKLDRVLRDMAFTALGPTQPTPSVGSGEAKGNT